jgi:non-specific serine/threonine protein kinase
LLSGGGPAGQPNHRTLQAALEWSYDLLTDGEQAMWRRVSVFAGSFDLDAAEAVCAAGQVAARETADLIDALVAKSILLREGQSTARYRLLDTIRDFGETKLRGRGNERALRLRHQGWYAALAARQEAFGPGRAEWIAALDADHGNLRAALEFCLSEPGRAAAGVQLACDLWRYWETHGHLTEGRRVLAALLERLDQASAARPRALWVAGYLAMVQGDLPAARPLLEAGLSAARLAGDRDAEAWSSSFLGFVIYSLGETEDGQALADSALRLHEETGNQIGIALALGQTVSSAFPPEKREWRPTSSPNAQVCPRAAATSGLRRMRSGLSAWRRGCSAIHAARPHRCAPRFPPCAGRMIRSGLPCASMRWPGSPPRGTR